MKMTEGLFDRIFDEIGAEYPEIAKEHWTADIGAAKLADTPEAFDAAVMPNLHGDVLSDVAAQIAGSVGMAGSANVGTAASMFEAIHGSAPRRTGQNLANPSGLLPGGVMMMVHIGQWKVSERVHSAWLRTLEDGIHTYDIFEPSVSREKVGTKELAKAAVARPGRKPEKLKAVSCAPAGSKRRKWTQDANRTPAKVELVGVDLHMGSNGQAPQAPGEALTRIPHDGLTLKMIDDRGAIVYPGGMAETFLTDGWRRFENGGKPATQARVVALCQKVVAAGYDVVKTKTLRTFNGKQGCTLAQGQ